VENRDSDSYSPNQILCVLLISLFFIILACGQTLWVPASRIENLYIRSIVLSVTNSAAAFSSEVGLHSYLPRWRQSFLNLTGLAENNSWDNRYFNRKDAATILSPEKNIVSEVSAPSDTQPISESSNPVTTPPAAPLSEAEIRKKAPSFSVHSSENPLKVFMFGDSQVFSLGSGLSRLTGKESPIDVEFLAVHSSGFIRADYYNWPSKLADTFKAASYEAAVIMLGMNDFQSFWSNTGEILKKETPAWEAAYKEKCREIIDSTLASVPRVYWIGMPEVKNAEYDDSLVYIDSVQNSLAGEYSPDTVVRISLKDTFPGAGKPYRDVLDRPGNNPVKMMSSDGTHYTVEGGQVIMEPLFDRLTQDYLFSEVPVANHPE